MNPCIEVTARTVYGSALLYPANDQARHLADMVGTRTITVGVLKRATLMGFDIHVTGDDRSVNAARASLEG